MCEDVITIEIFDKQDPIENLNFIDPIKEWQPFTKTMYKCEPKILKRLKYMTDGRHLRIKYNHDSKEIETQINGFSGILDAQIKPYLDCAISKLLRHVIYNEQKTS